MESERPQTEGGRQYATTHWSVVLAAGRNDTQGCEALGKLYQTYWRPLYSFARHRGHSPADAEDSIQEFFVHLLEKHSLGNAQPGRGKFRSFLLTAFRNFLVNQWQRGQAQKRGGGAWLLSLDTSSAETRYRLEPAENSSPEKFFDRKWYLTLLEAVLDRLRAEQEKDGKLEQFKVLRAGLMSDERTPYSELANRLHSTEAAVKMAVKRLKTRYAELLWEEVARTVSHPAEVEEELRCLRSVLGSR